MSRETPNTDTTAVQVRGAQLKTVNEFIQKAMPQIARALPKIGLSEDRLARIAFTTIAKSPHLHSADPKTLVACIIESAQLGLSLDTNLGHAYLVPFKGKVQLMPGYRGLIALMDRSGLVKDVVCELVYDGDLFEYEIGMDRDILRWKPITKPAERTDDKITHAFAIIRLVNGGTRHRVLDIEDILDARNRSASWQNAPNSSPWKGDFPEMSRKTALRRVSKISPLSPDLQRALSLDDAVDAGDTQDVASEVFEVPVEQTIAETQQGSTTPTVEKIRERVKAEKTEKAAPAPAAAASAEKATSFSPADFPNSPAAAAAAKAEAPVEEAQVVDDDVPPPVDENDATVASGPVRLRGAKPTETASPDAQPEKPKRGRPAGSKKAQPTPSASGQPTVAQVAAAGGGLRGDESVLVEPKERAKQLLNGDVELLKKVSLELFNYERDNFDDLFQRESVAIVGYMMQKERN